METRSKATITPGPWEIEASKSPCVQGPSIIAGPFMFGATKLNIQVASINMHHGETMANARLISAAPDLLEVLEEILADTSLKGSGHPLEAKANDVIDKATAT